MGGVTTKWSKKSIKYPFKFHHNTNLSQKSLKIYIAFRWEGEMFPGEDRGSIQMPFLIKKYSVINKYQLIYELKAWAYLCIFRYFSWTLKLHRSVSCRRVTSVLIGSTSHPTDTDRSHILCRSPSHHPSQRPLIWGQSLHVFALSADEDAAWVRLSLGANICLTTATLLSAAAADNNNSKRL